MIQKCKESKNYLKKRVKKAIFALNYLYFGHTLKKLFKAFVLLTIIILSSLISIFLWLNRSTYNIPSKGFDFEVLKGDTSYTVSRRLHDADLIQSKALFIFIARAFRLDNNLKVGWIELQTDSSTVGILNSIYGGNFVSVSFTVPEGSTINDIKQILIENNISDEESIDEYLSDKEHISRLGLPDNFKSVEGFLFPETYKFYKGVSVEKIFFTMVKLYYSKLEEIYPGYRELSRNQLFQKMTLASIIEKEVRRSEESSIVAGVFYNRIKTGMKLQSCATIQYILEKPKEQLLESDLFIDHPYNTYIYRGLPPGPICNPGFNAINAAFNPAKHQYFFFVVKDPKKGSHHFSKTYEEHLEAQKKYKIIKGFL